MRYAEIGLRCLLGLVFLVSSVSKMSRRGSFRSFKGSLLDTGLLSRSLAGPAAVCVVTGEIAIWVSLAIPLESAGIFGFGLSAGMLAVFAVGILMTVRRGVGVPCRCFGASVTPLGMRHVGRNLLLAAGGVCGIVSVTSPGQVATAGAALAACCGVVLGGLVAVLDDIFELFRPAPKVSRTRAAR
ncbi:MauE/DoxX family redox-associated membrane protein [Streptomyces mobaraensis]|uniref:MauE/DoxX family redox-associated membrane protein n=1 Tax=Streptomyces mobaraensis TaxID=35621 RepID=UPI00332AFDB4